jgi:hypothetical protein
LRSKLADGATDRIIRMGRDSPLQFARQWRANRTPNRFGLANEVSAPEGIRTPDVRFRSTKGTQ